jgi:hypothetical protein
MKSAILPKLQDVLKSVILSLSLSLSLVPQPSLGLGPLRNLLPLKMAEFLGGFSTIFFFRG